MHLIVPFAASLSEPCQHALTRLAPGGDTALPHLSALLAGVAAHDAVTDDEYALHLPHERVLAQAMGWPAGADGTLPWASWWAAQDGLALPPGETWALLSPGHWLMGRDHLTLIDPAQLQLTEGESRALFDAVAPFFESDGWTLRFGAPSRWYATHPTLTGLPTASLDRVIGRNPDVWLTDHPQARVLRRLQAEAQMLWYQHPLHDERQSRGLLPVNSFWVSGCGVVREPAPLQATVLTDLRAPLLADDMPAWLDAWQALDAGPLAEAHAALDAGQPVTLTLCGERHARTWAHTAAAMPAHQSGLKGWWHKLTGARPGRAAPALNDTLGAL
ncbi:MAG: hypothetical protein RI907_3783 [Pseudomonadota bacterium]|jgi:hypothetical protein